MLRIARNALAMYFRMRVHSIEIAIKKAVSRIPACGGCSPVKILADITTNARIDTADFTGSCIKFIVNLLMIYLLSNAWMANVIISTQADEL